MRNLLRFLILSSLVLILLASHIEITHSDDSAVQKSINNVIFELFIRHDLYFEVVVFGEHTKLNKLNGILRKHQRKSLKIQHYRNQTLLKVEHPSVILIDNKTLKSINYSSIEMSNDPQNSIKFLFIMDQVNYELHKYAVNPGVWEGHFSQFSYFLINNRTHVSLKTFEWWTKIACNQTQLVTMNIFDKKTSNWQQKLEIPEKFLNLHGCTLKVYSTIFHLYFADVIRRMPSLLEGSFINFLPDEERNFIKEFIPSVLTKRQKLESFMAEIFAGYANFSANIIQLNDPDFVYDFKDIQQNFTFVQFSWTHRENRA